MKSLCLFVVLVMGIGLTSCAWTNKMDDSFVSRNTQEKRLALAKKLLADNKVAAATDVLVKVCSGKGVPGVTDEALFRLALLYLGSGQGKSDLGQTQQLLERLQREYPASSWRSHAASLTELIVALNRKIRSLRGENISLSRENRELRLNIEKLKILDIEQELKYKR